MKEGLFHLSVKMVQRSKGRSATAAIAYRAGIDIRDERTGESFDYTRKSGISYSEIVLPEGAPEQFRDRRKLWNAVEQAEVRTNSAVAREFEIALPFDVPRHAREQLVSEVTHYIVSRFGVPADANCHDPHPRKTNEENNACKNFHVHILTGTRRLTSEGFTDKVRELDSAKTGSAIVDEIRKHWANMVNAAYAKHGIERFVDYRSYNRRGLDEVPQIHVGVNQRGDRAEQNSAIIAARSYCAQLEHETAAIELQIRSLLVEQTLPGETIPLFVVETSPERTPLPSQIVSKRPEEADARQLKIDFGQCAPSPATCTTITDRGLTENADKSEILNRYKQLEKLKKEAGLYGRAIAALSEQRSDMASFERELSALVRPSFIHSFLSTRRWQDYEDERAKLLNRIRSAHEKSGRLQIIVNEYRASQARWDQTGYAEHKALANVLGFSHVEKRSPPSLAPAQSNQRQSSIAVGPSRGKRSHAPAPLL